jgi:uncharacterized integral membrane protein
MATAERTSSRPASRQRPVSRTRVSAVWAGIVVGAVVLVLLIVFMLQNTAPVQVSFFALHGSAPLALTLLIAGVGVGVVALIVGSLRIAQLRRRIGDDRKAEVREAEDRKAEVREAEDREAVDRKAVGRQTEDRKAVDRKPVVPSH